MRTERSQSVSLTARRVWLPLAAVAFLAAGGWLTFGGSGPSAGAPASAAASQRQLPPPARDAASAPPQLELASFTSRRLLTKPIELVRVGDRVLGRNPDRSQVVDEEAPDQATWRLLEVRQVKPSGKLLIAQLLRPQWWVEENVEPEFSLVEIDLPHLGVEGYAEVLAVRECPRVAPGAGQVVTATFKHQPDCPLVGVTIGGETLGCTSNHPFWSEDRHDFIEAGQLRVGEHVRSRAWQVMSVEAITTLPVADWVYNLEVNGEHVYEVGHLGILVHNECNIVFRGLKTGEDPSKGLFARAPGANTPIASHVAGKKASSWISTTKDVRTAIDKYNKDKAGIVAIDLSKVKSKTVDLSGGHPQLKGRQANYAKKDKEVLIEDFIPPEAIVIIKMPG
jgi:Pretoxin HINT domain